MHRNYWESKVPRVPNNSRTYVPERYYHDRREVTHVGMTSRGYYGGDFPRRDSSWPEDYTRTNGHRRPEGSSGRNQEPSERRDRRTEHSPPRRAAKYPEDSHGHHSRHVAFNRDAAPAISYHNQTENYRDSRRTVQEPYRSRTSHNSHDRDARHYHERDKERSSPSRRDRQDNSRSRDRHSDSHSSNRSKDREYNGHRTETFFQRSTAVALQRDLHCDSRHDRRTQASTSTSTSSSDLTRNHAHPSFFRKHAMHALEPSLSLMDSSASTRVETGSLTDSDEETTFTSTSAAIRALSDYSTVRSISPDLMTERSPSPGMLTENTAGSIGNTMDSVLDQRTEDYQSTAGASTHSSLRSGLLATPLPTLLFPQDHHGRKVSRHSPTLSNTGSSASTLFPPNEVYLASHERTAVYANGELLGFRDNPPTRQHRPELRNSFHSDDTHVRHDARYRPGSGNSFHSDDTMLRRHSPWSPTSSSYHGDGQTSDLPSRYPAPIPLATKRKNDVLAENDPSTSFIKPVRNYRNQESSPSENNHSQTVANPAPYLDRSSTELLSSRIPEAPVVALSRKSQAVIPLSPSTSETSESVVNSADKSSCNIVNSQQESSTPSIVVSFSSQEATQSIAVQAVVEVSDGDSTMAPTISSSAVPSDGSSNRVGSRAGSSETSGSENVLSSTVEPPPKRVKTAPSPELGSRALPSGSREAPKTAARNLRDRHVAPGVTVLNNQQNVPKPVTPSTPFPVANGVKESAVQPSPRKKVTSAFVLPASVAKTGGVSAATLDMNITAVMMFDSHSGLVKDEVRSNSKNVQPASATKGLEVMPAYNPTEGNTKRRTRPRAASNDSGHSVIYLDDSNSADRSFPGSGTELIIVPKHLTAPEVLDYDVTIRKRRRVEVFVPDYKAQEPRRFVGLFPPKVTLEISKLMAAITKPEKNKSLPSGKITINDIADFLKHPFNDSEEIKIKLFLYAVQHHRKQENLIAVVCLLLANNVNTNIKDANGNTALKIALDLGDIPLIDILLQWVDHVSLDTDLNSALHIAANMWCADRENWNIVTLVLEHSKASLLFTRNNMCRSALATFFAERDFTTNEVEEIVVAYGAASIDQHVGSSFLHLLAEHRRIDILKFCLSRYPFNPNRVDAKNRTILHHLATLAALDNHNVEMLAEMVQHLGVSLDVKDASGKTALEIADRSGNRHLGDQWRLAAQGKFAVEQGYLVRDISLGKEPFPIRVTNEKNDRRLTGFVYVRQNIYLGDGPTTKGTMHCGCRAGQCSTTSCPCLKRGLAYSASGTIVPGTCKGNPIFECGPLCACGPNCSSRVVQKGIRMPFEIFMTAKRGWGVRTTRTIQPGEFIMEFVGEIVESDRLLARDPQNDWAMELTVDNYEGTMYHVDPTNCGNVARFLNHSCDPNLFPVRVYQSGDSVDTGIRMAMFSAQVIQKSHELTFFYGDEYWERQNERDIHCECGVAKCKYRRRAGKKRVAK